MTLADLRAQLGEARAAYHALITGKAVVKLLIEGELVEYRRAEAATLDVYIQRLESQIAAGGASASRGPIQVLL